VGLSVVVLLVAQNISVAFTTQNRDLNTASLPSSQRDYDISPPFQPSAAATTATIARPPLSALIGDNNTDIKADVQFLFDFAILGHPKTATTCHLHWLRSHSAILMPDKELHALQRGKPAALVQQLYDLSAGDDDPTSTTTAPIRYKRGYKAPRDIMSLKVLRALAQYWPKTKLMVGVRHPIAWFQSFYNYRLRNGVDMPPAETLIGACVPAARGVCTHGARFHLHLSYLGKTDVATEQERHLLQSSNNGTTIRAYRKPANLPRLPNPVFLYDPSQLQDSTPRLEQYRSDLQTYLGLEEPLSPIADEEDEDWGHASGPPLDICEDRYEAVRAVLLQHAQAASVWIRTYFMTHPDVNISSPEHFAVDILERQWMIDPCLVKVNVETQIVQKRGVLEEPTGGGRKPVEK
jgi:hypothetical protein